MTASKIAVVVRTDLAVWQKLNVTAFLVSGVVGVEPGVVGEPYLDASGVSYLPMLRQPVLVFAADGAPLRRAFERALSRGLRLSVYTDELFKTGNDVDNRAAVEAVATDGLRLSGFAVHGDRKVVDKALDGLKLHP